MFDFLGYVLTIVALTGVLLAGFLIPIRILIFNFIKSVVGDEEAYDDYYKFKRERYLIYHGKFDRKIPKFLFGELWVILSTTFSLMFWTLFLMASATTLRHHDELTSFAYAMVETLHQAGVAMTPFVGTIMFFVLAYYFLTYVARKSFNLSLKVGELNAQFKERE